MLIFGAISHRRTLMTLFIGNNIIVVIMLSSSLIDLLKFLFVEPAFVKRYNYFRLFVL